MAWEVRPGLELPEAAVTWRFSRSSGPGGQGVNTTDSRAEAVVDLAAFLPPHLLARAVERLGSPTLSVTSSEHRSQLQNREAALARALDRIREAVAPPPPPRRPTKPSRAAKQRRLDVKRQRSQLKRSRRARPDD